MANIVENLKNETWFQTFSIGDDISVLWGSPVLLLWKLRGPFFRLSTVIFVKLRLWAPSNATFTWREALPSQPNDLEECALYIDTWVPNKYDVQVLFMHVHETCTSVLLVHNNVISVYMRKTILFIGFYCIDRHKKHFSQIYMYMYTCKQNVYDRSEWEGPRFYVFTYSKTLSVKFVFFNYCSLVSIIATHLSPICRFREKNVQVIWLFIKLTKIVVCSNNLGIQIDLLWFCDPKQTWNTKYYTK